MRRTRHRLRAVLVLCLVAAGAAGCGRTYETVNAAASTLPTTAASRDGFAIRAKLLPPHGAPHLPDGYSTVIASTGDPNGEGLWLLAASTRTVTLFAWRPGRSALRSWNLGGTRALGEPDRAFLAVSRNGQTAWVAIDDTVFSVATAGTTVSSFAVPPVPQSSYVPAVLAASHALDGLAAGADGTTVAVGEVGASAVPVMTTSGAVAHTVDLPTGTSVAGLAYSRSGALAVALVQGRRRRAHGLLIRSASGTARTVAVESQVLSAGSEGFIAGTSRRPVSVGADGAIVRHPPVPPAPSSGPYRALVGQNPIVISTSAVAYGTASGIAVVDETASAVTNLVLPEYDCSNPGQGPAPPGHATDVAHHTCNAFPVSLTSDGRGDIWYRSSAPGKPIAEVPHDSY